MKYTAIILAFLAAGLYAGPLDAQDDQGKRKKKSEEVTATPPAPTPAPEPKKDNPFKEIAEVTKACRIYEGLFNIYQDTVSGKTFMEIPEDRFGAEVIYFNYVHDGVTDAGYTRGAYRDLKVFAVEMSFDRI